MTAFEILGAIYLALFVGEIVLITLLVRLAHANRKVVKMLKLAVADAIRLRAEINVLRAENLRLRGGEPPREGGIRWI